MTLAEPGGAQHAVASLLPALGEAFDVTVAAHGSGPLRDATTRAGMAFVELRHVRRPLHPLHDLLGLAELVALMLRLRPLIVHAHSSKAGVLARLAATVAAVPVRIFTVHGWAFAAHGGRTARAYRWADRLMRRLTTLTICVAASELHAGCRARTCDPARTVVIPNGVELGAPGRAGPTQGPPVILSVGRLRAPKDAECLVRALGLLRSRRWQARIVGAGPDAPAIATAVERLGLGDRIELLGERLDVPALMAEADVFALASRSEGLPVSILEAMAAGLPVVASRVGGVPELVVAGVTGALVRPGRPDELAAALAPLLEDPSLRARQGHAGRVRAEARFGLDNVRRAHVELYTALLRAAG